jgi:protein O-mannosyl-transferase
MIAVVTIALVYRVGLSGPFVFDDYPTIIDNPKVASASLTYDSLKDAAFSRGTGITARPLALLTFALNTSFVHGASNAYWYKVTNLTIHLVNTILIFLLSRLVLSRYLSDRTGSESDRDVLWVSALIAAAWGLHPLNLDPVLYVTQRMTSLATLFMLGGIVTFLVGRQCILGAPRRGLLLMIVGAVVGVGLGLLAKEIALLVPLYLVVIELVFFGSQTESRPASVRWFHVVATGTLVVGACAYLLVHYHEQVAVYATRDFSVRERLLTEARVLWFYGSLLVLPIPHRFSLFHDDIAISTSLFAPWTTIPSVLGLFATVICAIAFRRRWPLISFAVLWFVVGHTMESSFIGLEIAHEHRNYLPSFGPLFAVVYGLTRVIRGKTSSRWIAAAAPALLAIAVLSFVTIVCVHAWASERTLIASMAHDHPNSPRSLTMLGEWKAVRRDDPSTALLYYSKAMVLSPTDAGIRLRAAMAAAQPVFQTQLRARNPGGQERLRQLAMDLSDIVTLDPPGGGAPKLQDRFVDQTAQILRGKPLSADSQEMLVRLGRCLDDVSHPCGLLAAPAAQWYSAVLANPNVNATLADYATLTLFDLAIARKDYLAALDAADSARRRDPGNPTYELMRANAFILLKNYRQATAILDAIMQHKSVAPEIRENVATLQGILEQHQDRKRAAARK